MYAKLSDKDIPTINEWITLPEAAQRLGISRQYAYKRAADDYFQSLHKIGDELITYVVSTEEVDRLVAEKNSERLQLIS